MKYDKCDISVTKKIRNKKIATIYKRKESLRTSTYVVKSQKFIDLFFQRKRNSQGYCNWIHRTKRRRKEIHLKLNERRSWVKFMQIELEIQLEKVFLLHLKSLWVKKTFPSLMTIKIFYGFWGLPAYTSGVSSQLHKSCIESLWDLQKIGKNWKKSLLQS